ncbi:Multimodular transpeptidase-transglycosylase [Lutibaculum baratangense AMV1]|uniref:Penicillin-binding protein 1A n=2 Tax=Lutibaculum TaxID=1358438 RepID=V4RG09_9HYPH|nr:Multimodular transpeptidase-transglycosylase [Lutibaculum baratangense AMV1]
MLVRFIGFLFTIGVIVFVVGAAGAGYILWRVNQDLPDYAKLRDYEPPVMTRIHASDGQLVAEYATQRRLYLPIQAVPADVVNAFLSAEDKNFYSHIGLDFFGISRAVLENVRDYGTNRRPVGASTITQQVAKNFLLTNEVSIERKLKEALLALRIESAFTKEEILELYLNEIYLGLGSYGIAAAALNYFDKSVHELTVPEAAYLAALPKGPENYHPFRFPDRAIERRNWVIDRMQENGYLSSEQAAKARDTELRVTPRPRGTRIASAEYFAEEVRRMLYERYGTEGLYEGGLSVRTTLDPELQQLARRVLVQGLVRYDRQRSGWTGPVDQVEIGGDWGQAVGAVEALSDVAPWRLAVVLRADEREATIGLQPERLPSGSLSNQRTVARLPYEHMKWAGGSVSAVLKPGDVVWVSPVDTPADEETEPDADSSEDSAAADVYRLQQKPKVSGAIVVMDPHTGRVLAMTGGFSFAESEFNRATQAMRQPGSSFKPFIYAAALDNGYTPSSVVMDAPIEIRSGRELWRPQNYGGSFAGPSTLRRGIEKSRNVMTVRLAQDMGMPLIREYAKRFGIYDNLGPYLPNALGASETTVLRMTAAYAMLANGGVQIQPTLVDRIQDRYGRTIYRHDERQCVGCNVQEWQGQDEPELVDNRQVILDPYTAYQITSMLEGVVQRGTATTVSSVGKPLAGKTGTTNDEKDAWFVGYSPDLTVGVFIGFDQPKPMGQGSTGGGIAAPVFRDFMQVALKDKPAVPFRVPPGIQLVRINPNTGLRAEGQGTILEAFKPGQEPPSSYSVIGYRDTQGQEVTVSPEVDRAVQSGSGGLY